MKKGKTSGGFYHPVDARDENFMPGPGFKKTVAKKMKVVKREALVGGKKAIVKGYKDPVSGLVHPSKEAYKDRYQPK